MLKRRIIPCLDVRAGRTVKGINFVDIRDAGDPVELATLYAEQGADELVFLDITATEEKRKTLVDMVSKVAAQINIPFTVGGGITSVVEAGEVILAGADKIGINSSAVKNPTLINEIAAQFGSQCVVVAVDAKWENDDWWVYVSGGKIKTKLKVLDWVVEAEQRGAGEILLTSINHDGTKSGFGLELTQKVSAKINIPVIASGGAGTMEHLAQVFNQTRASGALAASIFHFGEIPIPQLKAFLKTNKIPVR